MPLLLAAVAMLIPLAIAPGVLFYFDVTPKAVILLGGTAAAVLTMAHRKGALPKLPKYFLALVAIYFLCLTISTIRSTDWQLSLIGTNWRRFGLLTHAAALLFAVAVVFTLAGRPTARLRLLRSIAAGGVLASLYGTLQYFGYDPWLPNDAYTIGEGEWAIIRPPATLGHASYAATYYLFAVFMGLGVARADRAGVWRGIGMAAVGLGSIAIVLSGTRAAILGLLAGCVGLMLVSWRRQNGASGPLPDGTASVPTAPLKSWGGPPGPRGSPWTRLADEGVGRGRGRPPHPSSPFGRGRLRIIALALVVLASFGAFYYSPAGQKLRARTRWSMEDAQGGARLFLWRDSLRMAAARPVLGWGPEIFTREFPRFQSKELAAAYPDFYHESPHNIFLDALVSTGALGLAALVALCGIGFYAALIAKKQAPAEASALFATLVAGIVAQQFTSFTIPTAFYLYLTIAILISLAAGDWPVKKQRPWGTAIPAILFIASAVRLAVADYHLLRASHALEQSDLEAAAAAFHRSSQWQRPGRSSDLWYSRALAASARNATLLMPGVRALQQGYAVAERATHTAEDPHNAYYNLASYCALRNDFKGVELSLRNAIHHAPNWFKPHWTLAQSLQLAGRLNEAEREGALAVELAGGKYPEVVQTLREIQKQRALK